MKSSMETRLKHIIPHNFVNNRRKYTKLAHMIGHDPPCWFMLILWHLLSDYKGRFLQLPVLLDTFFGKFTTSPAPANVGLQDDTDIILLVINNIGRGRKEKKSKTLFWRSVPTNYDWECTLNFMFIKNNLRLMLKRKVAEWIFSFFSGTETHKNKPKPEIEVT